MANIVSFNSYKLRKGASASDFLLAIETLMKKFVSMQKGFVSSTTLVDGETWADFTVFETTDDLKTFVPLCNKNDLARKGYTFMDFGTMENHVFTIERSFKKETNVTGNVASFNSYNLKEGVSVPDFLLATETLINNFVSKQKGWISSKKLFDGERWADFVVFETIDDLKAFIPLCNKNELAKKCWSFMSFGTLKGHVFTVKQSF